MAEESDERKFEDHLKRMSPDFGLLKTLIDELRDQMNEDFRAKDLPHPQDFIQPLSSGDLTVLVDMKVQEISNTPDCVSLG
eukprot:TRINITY_DN921_c0_g2_i1.p1 TRINITY_DN921_c0_g2~~TRINITY_DN921_c0_g2_i1.p1  ORF type:complete len:81 (-),score=21.94 TRINITY_DN921_c0_g2_i1:164-406(-)